METNKDLENTLKDVRSAYRLLFEYQKRIIDLVDYSFKHFGRTFTESYPRFSTEQNTKADKDLYGNWDTKNLYMHDFRSSTYKSDENEYNLAILVVSDTGYFINHKNSLTINKPKSLVENDKKNFQDFQDVDQSETKLIFIAGKNLWTFEGPFSHSFTNPELVLNKEGENKKGDDKMIYRSYNLSAFGNEDMTKRQLSDFEKYCEDKGVLVQHPITKKSNIND